MKVSLLLKVKNFFTNKPAWSIKFRLLFAMIVLSITTSIMAILALFWLNQTNEKISALHHKTVFATAQSFNLMKQINDLTSSAPFLLNLKTQYLVANETKRLSKNIINIKSIWNNWLHGTNESIKNSIHHNNIISYLTAMEKFIMKFSAALKVISKKNNSTSTLIQSLQLTNGFFEKNKNINSDDYHRIRKLQYILLSAIISENLVMLGEYQRKYKYFLKELRELNLGTLENNFYKKLTNLAEGTGGIFAIKESLFQEKLLARKNLYSIQEFALNINTETLKISKAIEKQINNRRIVTTNSINKIQYSILGLLFVCLLIAIFTIRYISYYVIHNLKVITASMTQLAHGELTTITSLKNPKKDEIRELFSAFNIFKTKTIELDFLLQETKNKTALIENTFKGMTEGILVSDVNGRVVLWNSLFLNILRINPEDIKFNLKLSGLLEHSRVLKRYSRNHIIQLSKLKYLEYEYNGSYVEIRKNKSKSGGYIWFVSDVTNKRHMKKRVENLEKLEKLGQLSGSIAHDFNNILTVIIGNLDLLSRCPPTTERFTKLLNQTQNAANLGTSLTQRLLAFAKQQHLKPENVEINSLILDITKLLNFSIGDNITLKFLPSLVPFIVKIDIRQLEHALLNICLNSSQSIVGKGEIIIKTSQCVSRKNVKIDVTDTGYGIESDIINHVFEPFFTNRVDGEGTGLGLSMVYGFVKQSGGTIEINSIVNKGTTISILLPLSRSKYLSIKTTNPSGKIKINKSVLIVEDIEYLRNTAEEIFKDLGLNVYSTDNAEDAQKLLTSNKKFDILFTDIYLKGPLNGIELAQKTLKTMKGTSIQIIITSAITNKKIIPKDIQSSISFLPKPYLATTIYEMLVSSNYTN